MNLNQVTVPCSNLENSIEFYAKLGLQLIVHSSNHYARFACPDGKSTFSVMQQENIKEDSSIKIYFEVLELDAKIDELIEKGIVIDKLPEDKPWLWREANLQDPFGNKIILYFAGENRVNPPWKLK